MSGVILYFILHTSYFKSDYAELITPRETVYSVIDIEIQQKLGLSVFTE